MIAELKLWRKSIALTPLLDFFLQPWAPCSNAVFHDLLLMWWNSNRIGALMVGYASKLCIDAHCGTPH